MKKILFLLFLVFIADNAPAQTLSETDSLKLEQLRRESRVDPTRIPSRASNTFLNYDQEGTAGQINNRLSLNVGVYRWNFSMQYDVVTRTTGETGSGITSGMGDLMFSMLNAFFVKGKHALAGSAEFSMPSGTFGTQYFSVTPSLTYSYTIKPSLSLAVQPQYTLHLMKDLAYPTLCVITVRSFLAMFTRLGYFFVFEPRPVIDLTYTTFDLIFSSIIGKALGGGFNLIALAEFPTNETTINNSGILYPFGSNKNF